MTLSPPRLRSTPSSPLTSAPSIPDVTVRALIADVATEVIAERHDDSVEYVPPGRTDCAQHIGCVPLARELGDGLAGHLHRRADVGSPSLEAMTALAEIIELKLACDLLDVSLARAHHRAENLQIALESNRTIGIAIGIVMATQHCVASEAFTVLVRASQQQHRKLRDIAADVELTGAVPEAAPATP